MDKRLLGNIFSKILYRFLSVKSSEFNSNKYSYYKK